MSETVATHRQVLPGRQRARHLTIIMDTWANKTMLWGLCVLASLALMAP